tara:strand:- start:7 stop:156 length:150 start_codon:yes stop_codon:yes gene_type:complete
MIKIEAIASSPKKTEYQPHIDEARNPKYRSTAIVQHINISKIKLREPSS